MSMQVQCRTLMDLVKSGGDGALANINPRGHNQCRTNVNNLIASTDFLLELSFSLNLSMVVA